MKKIIETLIAIIIITILSILCGYIFEEILGRNTIGYANVYSICLATLYAYHTFIIKG